MKKNDKFIARCIGYNKEGMGIVRHDNFVIFVPGLINGELAEILVLKVLRTYGFGKVEKIIEVSEHRIEPKCSVYKKCGGCHLQHMDRNEQAAFKKQLVKDCFYNIAHMDVELEDVIDMDCPYRYRNKVQVPFKEENGKVNAGFYRQHSNSIIEFEDCLVQTTTSNKLVKFIRNEVEKLEVGSFFRHTLIKHAHNTNEIMVVLVTTRYPFPKMELLADAIVNNFDEVVSVIVNVNDKDTNVVLGEKEYVLAKGDLIKEELSGMYFNISSKSFYQINPIQTKKLYDKAIELANITKDDNVIDLYCGTGTIGLLASHKAKKVIGIEIVPSAIDDAKVNAKNNGVNNIEFICADAKKGAQMLIERGEKVDVVIVDPPRKGCDQKTIDAINVFHPRRLVYVSCDPATLARDVERLGVYGYQPQVIQPVDMFPLTAHVETVVQLFRKTPDTHINIKLDTNELDLTKAEAKATYQEIKDYVLEKYDKKVSTLNIAQIKEKYGIIERENYNKPKSENVKQPQCTKDKEEAIMNALRHFKMI